MLYGKELKNCSDDELLTGWLDGTDATIEVAIVREVRLRRAFREVSTYRYGHDRFPL